MVEEELDGQEGSEIGVREKRETGGRKKREGKENRAGELPWSVHVPQPPAFDQDCDGPKLTIYDPPRGLGHLLYTLISCTGTVCSISCPKGTYHLPCCPGSLPELR